MNFVIDCTMPNKMSETISRLGNIYKSARLDIEDEAVSTHPDIQIHFINDNTAICAPSVYEYYKESLPKHINIICGNSKIGRKYPENSAYNVARIGNFILCNTKFTENGILNYYEENSFKIIDVKQGYTKCNICIVNENTFITEDRGIYNIAKNVDGLNPILIEQGGVKLDGFDYGFIGGASGVADNTVLFCGSIKGHKDFETIYTAIKKADKNYIELSDSKLIDCGSIIAFR